MRRRGMIAAVAVLGAVLVGCSPSAPSTPDSVSRSPSPSATPSLSASPTPTPTSDPLAGLSLQQKVGQLFLVGTPATSAAEATIGQVRDLQIGGVFLSGRSTAGLAATQQIVAQFTSASTSAFPLLVSTDQEGGTVQVLQGEGFAPIPSALDQAGMAPADLEQQAAAWGQQLRTAGVNMNLAPVADVIDSPQQAAGNPPIGQLGREYGYGVDSVATAAAAFGHGMLAAGVVPVAKHFPGLGAVTQNTDFSSSVTDTTTGASSASTAAFGALIDGGVPAVMMSNAVYTQIDPSTPAVFSPAAVDLLRDGLDFDGVIVTDDVSAAAQLQAWTPADRAINALSAGADIVLVSASPELAPEMIAAVVAKAQEDPAFAARIDEACSRVVLLKEQSLR